MTTSFEDFCQRLSTFDALNWRSSARGEVTPLLCARYGWRSGGLDVLFCKECRTDFPFTDQTFRRRSHRRDEPTVEKKLIERHAPHCVWRTLVCPEAYEHLQLTPVEDVSTAFLTRLAEFRRLWDLPTISWEIRDASLTALSESLRSTDAKDGSTTRDDPLENRSRCEMVLALLGWQLKWHRRLTYLHDGRDVYSEGRYNDPAESNLLFGRQCYVLCPLCQATWGLWGVQTFSDLTQQSFLEMRKKESEQSVRPLTGRGSVKRKRVEDEREEPSSRLKTSHLGRGAFGMHRFKRMQSSDAAETQRRMPQSEGPSPEPIRLETYSPVTSSKQLDPVKGHRPFCPYRKEWRLLLRELVGKE